MATTSQKKIPLDRIYIQYHIFDCFLANALIKSHHVAGNNNKGASLSMCLTHLLPVHMINLKLA